MAKSSIDLFVPGRLCMFGEHTDWAGHYRTMNADLVPGMAIVTGIEQGIFARAEVSEKFEVCNESEVLRSVWKDFSCEMSEQALKAEAKSGAFFSYCAGVASYMLEWYKVGGVKITITDMTLPMKSGLSSSAAICVLVTRAFNQLYSLNLSTKGEMNIAYLGEARTPSRCGRLDQACAFGVKPTLMEFDGEELEVSSINVKKRLYWVFADLCASKDTITILRDLNKGYPFAGSEMEFRLQDALGPKNQDIISRAVKYINEGEREALGKLMDESQELFDSQVAPMCPSQLTAPKLHQVLADPEIRKLVYGGKGVGSQGDGSVQFLAKDEECQEKLVDYLNTHGMRAYKLTIRNYYSLRKAIIPVAGFGTRLYPSTRGIRKEFFPIVDSKDSMVKPVILILLEELIAGGIEDICIVLSDKEERKQYADFFEKPLTEEHLSRLSPEQRKYEQHILELGTHLTYVYQTEKRGFGDAVYRCAKFAGNDPVLLVLGDTIYKSHSNKSCTLQMVQAYERFNCPIVSIHEVPLADVSFFGMVTGEWEDSKQEKLVMSTIKEKPTVAYAEANLGVKSPVDGKDRYYGVFGQYVLTPEVFEQLGRDIKAADASGSKGEIELTSALEAVRESSGMVAFAIDGDMFDMGNPRAFRDTVSNY